MYMCMYGSEWKIRWHLGSCRSLQGLKTSLIITRLYPLVYITTASWYSYLGLYILWPDSWVKVECLEFRFRLGVEGLGFGVQGVAWSD